MKHVYLSPHLDDAVLSCGGSIHRHTARGEPVRVVTVLSAEFAGENLSDFALFQHRLWGEPPQPMALRRAEDVAALATLGAEVEHLSYLDAVYRGSDQGLWMYTDLTSLFGDVHADDPLGLSGAQGLVDELAARIAPADQSLIYAPLGAGGHVDHRIVHAAAQGLRAQGYRLAFYEDYPYAEQPGAVQSALERTGGQGWRPETIPLEGADLGAKVAALACYRSQLPVLFGAAERMPDRVRSFAAGLSPGGGLAERIWWPAGR
jgi:LmbE family N-acetylglucosaminyl deacetylase